MHWFIEFYSFKLGKSIFQTISFLLFTTNDMYYSKISFSHRPIMFIVVFRSAWMTKFLVLVTHICNLSVKMYMSRELIDIALLFHWLHLHESLDIIKSRPVWCGVGVSGISCSDIFLTSLYCNKCVDLGVRNVCVG